VHQRCAPVYSTTTENPRTPMRRNQPLQHPTFAQTVVVIQTMPTNEQDDLEAIKRRHLALGFHYPTDQIYRALKAIRDPARRWHQRNRASGFSRM